jgi:O-antigen ligase
LRFVRDDPAELQRATGLWIDPNAFGGYLLITGALTFPQVFSHRPALPRWLAVICMGLIALALVLTVSRAAMLGLAAVGLGLGLLKYRRALIVIALVLVAVLALPQTRELVGHFVDGFMGRDLATQMRFGEYEDAIRLIERYPLLGVGFVGTPDVDLYVGVSSMYLLVAQQMGLLGLAAFLIVLIVLFAGAAQAWRCARLDEGQCAVFLGAHGAVFGAMLSGLLDHYFFNIDFHNSVMLLWATIALATASQTSALRYNPANHDGTRSQVPQKG